MKRIFSLLKQPVYNKFQKFLWWHLIVIVFILGAISGGDPVKSEESLFKYVTQYSPFCFHDNLDWRKSKITFYEDNTFIQEEHYSPNAELMVSEFGTYTKSEGTYTIKSGKYFKSDKPYYYIEFTSQKFNAPEVGIIDQKQSGNFKQYLVFNKNRLVIPDKKTDVKGFEEFYININDSYFKCDAIN